MKFPAIFRKRESVPKGKEELKAVLRYQLEVNNALLIYCNKLTEAIEEGIKLLTEPDITNVQLRKSRESADKWKVRDKKRLPMPELSRRLTASLKPLGEGVSIGEYAVAHIAAYPKHPHPQWNRTYWVIETKKEKNCKVLFSISVLLPEEEAGQEWTGTYHTQGCTVQWEDEDNECPAGTKYTEKYFTGKGEADFTEEHLYLCVQNSNPLVTDNRTVGIYQLADYALLSDGEYHLMGVKEPLPQPDNKLRGTEFHDLTEKLEVLKWQAFHLRDLLSMVPDTDG